MATVYGKRGYLIRIAYLVISMLFSPIGLFLTWWRKSVVLCYHGVSDSNRLVFQDQMCWLNWFFLKKKCDNGLQKNCKVPVLVTFDDAFENLIENAIPVIEKYNIPVYIFAVPGNLGTIPTWTMPADHSELSSQIMDKQQLLALAQKPLVTFGSHTYNHANLAQASVNEIDQELLLSKDLLEKLLGKSVDDFALPYGAYTDHVIEKAILHGYKRIFTLDPEFCSENQEGKIGRFLMSPDVWKIEFILTCIGGYWWFGPWRRFIRQIKSIL